MNSKRLVPISLISISLSFLMPIANADTDPFPGVAYRGEIPGTRVSGDPGISCGSGSGKASESGGAGGSFSYCIKLWQPQATIDHEADFTNRINLAKSAATLESQQWNAAHPGEQKCVTYGPIVHANGVTTHTGGVCANVVGTKPDGTTSAVAPTQVGTTPTTTTPTTTTPTTTTPTTTTPTTTTTDTRSSTTTPTPVVDTTRNSMELNKIRAIALNKSQQTANLNPGTIWCVPWSFENQSGQECSYQPIESNIMNGPRMATSTVIVPTIIPSKTVQTDGTTTSTTSTNASTTDTPTSTTSSKSDTKTAIVFVKTTIDSTTANTGQDFGGTVTQVKQAVSSMVEDTITAKAINTVLQKVSDLSKITIKTSAKLPTSKDLDISATSNSASICTVSNTKITVKKTGTCKLEYSVTDSNDNTFSINTVIKVKK